MSSRFAVGSEAQDLLWKNHGEYVSCVSHIAKDFAAAGQIFRTDKDDAISTAARSACGN
jgi:hypothetical protein